MLSNEMMAAIIEPEKTNWQVGDLNLHLSDSEAEDEECISEQLKAWNNIEGPSNYVLNGENFNQSGPFDIGISEDDVLFVANALNEFLGGKRMFQPMPENFVEEPVKKEPKIIGGYLFGQTIGEGSYGKVKEVLEVNSLSRKAVKIIKGERLKKIPCGKENVAQELRILRYVQHRNVISVDKIIRDAEKQKLYIIMDICAGSLQQMLDGSSKNRFPLFQAHKFFVQLIDGLSYLHSRGIIHKDIKPGNLLVTFDGVLKISDFGVAEMLSMYEAEDWCTNIQGTPKFQPPEIVSGAPRPYRGSKVDIWASGVTLYNLVSGEYPFNGEVIMQLFDNIAKKPLKMPTNVVLPQSLNNLLEGLLVKDPEKRITIDEIRRSDWFSESYTENDVSRVKMPPSRSVSDDKSCGIQAVLKRLIDKRQEMGFECSSVCDEGQSSNLSARELYEKMEVDNAYDSSLFIETKRTKSILSMCMGSRS